MSSMFWLLGIHQAEDWVLLMASMTWASKLRLLCSYSSSCRCSRFASLPMYTSQSQMVLHC